MRFRQQQEHQQQRQGRSGRPLLFEQEISWFVLAGALDVFMTYIILRFSHDGQTQHVMIESNPLAGWILHRWGFRGMIMFKFAMVAVVVVIAEIVGRVRPTLARLLLNGGTAVVLAVVIYSLRLLLRNL